MLNSDLLSVGHNLNKGFLVLIGGAEDKKHNKSILRRIISLNNAKNVVIIPTASLYPTGLAEDYVYAFRDIGIENYSVLDIRQTSDTKNDEYSDKINNADLIFFTGGDQSRLVNIFNETNLLNLIKKNHNTGTTIAGTSAGAAAACDPILFDGDNSGMKKGSINFSKGFGFINNITIDTHFVNRGRLGRLTQFLSSGKCTRGIGLGEDTAIIVAPDNTFEVIGSEMVTIVNTDNVSYSNYNSIQDGDPIIINDIRVGFLQCGSRFDLNTWKVISSQGIPVSNNALLKNAGLFN